MVIRDGNTVEFRFYRPGARHVSVAGDFNGWRGDALPMKPAPGGYWTARTQLPTGTFKFRYFADGLWFTDFAAFGIQYGPYGPDSIVCVEPKPPRARPRADGHHRPTPAA